LIGSDSFLLKDLQVFDYRFPHLLEPVSAFFRLLVEIMRCHMSFASPLGGNYLVAKAVNR